MRLLKTMVVTSVLGLSIMGAVAWADDKTPDPTSPPTTSTPPEKQEKQKPSHARPFLPDDVKALVDKVKTDREAFAKEQAALLKTLKGATQEQRDKIREQLQDNRQMFLDSQRALREQIKDKLEALRKEFRDNRDKILDEVKDKTKDAKEHRGGN